MASYCWLFHNLWSVSYIILHIQYLPLYLPFYVPVQIWPFHVTPQLRYTTYPSKPLIFGAPILPFSLWGRIIILIFCYLLPYTMLSLILPSSSFMWSVYRSTYSPFRFSECNQTWLLLSPPTQPPFELTDLIDFLINPSPTYLNHNCHKPCLCSR